MVLAVVALDGGAAVAEEVICDRKARCVIGPPFQQPTLLRGEPIGYEAPGFGRCYPHAGAEPLNAEAGVDRQPLDRPRILNEQRRVVVHDTWCLDRRVPNVDGTRLTRGVVLIEDTVVSGGHAAVRANFVVVAELHAMRAGDVGHDGLIHVTRVVLALNLVRSPRCATGHRTVCRGVGAFRMNLDRKSTRLNSSHSQISYAVFCLKKKINMSFP